MATGGPASAGAADRVSDLLAVAIRTGVQSGATRRQLAAITAAAMRVATQTQGTQVQPADQDADGTEGSDGDDEQSNEVRRRSGVTTAAIAAHEALNIITAKPSHNLGIATQEAAGLLTAEELKALRNIRRKANTAKHVWPRSTQRALARSTGEAYVSPAPATSESGVQTEPSAHEAHLCTSPPPSRGIQW